MLIIEILEVKQCNERPRFLTAYRFEASIISMGEIDFIPVLVFLPQLHLIYIPEDNYLSAVNCVFSKTPLLYHILLW